MPPADGTCEYELNPNDPETWGGEEDDKCYVEGEALDQNGMWSCPYEPVEGEHLCSFHLPVRKKNDKEVVRAFLEIVEAPSKGDESISKERTVRILGGRFDRFDISEVTTSEEVASINCDIDMSHSRFRQHLDCSDVHFGGRVEFQGVVVRNRCNFSDVKFGGSASFCGAEFHSRARFQDVAFTDWTDISDIIFNDSATFVNSEFESVTFERTTFTNNADFRRTKYNGSAYYDEATFCEKSSFQNVVFNGETNFWEADFASGVNFDTTEFNGWTDFQGTRFGDDSNFEGATFNADVQFPDAIFESKAIFCNAVFRGDVFVQDITFGSGGEVGMYEEIMEKTADTDFSGVVFDNEVSFQGTTFEGTTAFTNVAFGGDVYISQCTFESDVLFTLGEFNAHASFADATFDGPVDFHQSMFNDTVIFDRATFNSEAIFADANLVGASFVEANVSDANFKQSSLESSDFSEADLSGANLERATLSNADLFGTDLSGVRIYGARIGDAAINTATVFDNKGSNRCVYDPDSEYEYDSGDDETVDRLTKAMGAYHLFEQLTKANTLPDKQSTFFKRRQDMRRSQLRQEGQRVNYWFAEAQNAIFKHGESFSRVVGWCVGTIVAFGFIFPLGGWFQSDSTGTLTYGAIAESPELMWNSFYHSVLLFLTGTGPLSPTGFVGELFTSIEALIAPILLALLIFVLGRRAAR